MNSNICACGCNEPVKTKGSIFKHGHHLRLQKYQRKKGKSLVNMCYFCKTEFISKKFHKTKQKFCSRLCASKSHKNGNNVECKNCAKTFYVPNHRLNETHTRGKYCSNQCRLEYWAKKSLKNNAPGTYKERAWKHYQEKCYDCGITDKRLLVIHHIDGNRNNGDINNLIPVCHNCHCLRHITMTGTNKIPSFRGRHVISE